MKETQFNTEDWKDYKRATQQIRRNTLKNNTDDLVCYCVENDIDLKKNNEYHYSLFKGGFRVDYWPTKKRKYHIIATNGRGAIDSIEEFGVIFDNLKMKRDD